MTSKVLMKLPTVPFPQGKKAPPDLVSLGERNNDGHATVRHQGLNMDRAAQLEQNMKFLQEQHQSTLVALHQEVETLRQRNRDLQFQLVFSKRAHCVSSSPSSPEDNGNGFAKSKGSPMSVNVTPLQVELLEKDLQDIKASLQEAKTHNQYLSSIIEQQKKRLDITEEQKGKPEVADVGVQVGDPIQASLVVLLEESYAMVKRLHKENLDQKKEIASLRAASTMNNGGPSRGGGRSRDGNNSHHSRGSPTSTAQQEQSCRKFPPLPIPSYWHRRSPRYSTSRHEKQDHQTDAESTVLPQLQNGSVKSEAAGCGEPPSYRSCEYRNYSRDGSGRKYRGQASRRDSNHYYHSRDFKDRNSKDRPRDAGGDTGESSKDADNPRRQ